MLKLTHIHEIGLAILIASAIKMSLGILTCLSICRQYIDTHFFRLEMDQTNITLNENSTIYPWVMNTDQLDLMGLSRLNLNI